MYDPTNPYAAPTPVHESQPVLMAEVVRPTDSLRAVAQGLTINYWAVVVLLIATIGAGALRGFANSRPGGIQTVSEWMLLCGWLESLSRCLGMAGRILCLKTPPETGVTGILYASIATAAISILCDLAIRMRLGPPAIAYLGGLFAAISTFIFLFYLGKIAQYIGRRELARKAKSVFYWFLGAMIAAVILVFAVAAWFSTPGNRPADSPGILAFIGLVAIVGGLTYLVTIVRYAKLLLALSAAIREGFAGDASSYPGS